MSLFYFKTKVKKHGSKKNQKKIFRNRKTGKMFIGSEIKTKALETSLVNLLVQEKKRQQIETITKDISAKFIFYFPRSEFLTLKGKRNQKLPDLSNALQSVEDALTKAGVIKDDCFICAHDGSRRKPSDDEFYWLEIELTNFVD